MILRVRSRRCAVGPASVAFPWPIVRAMFVGARSSGASPAVASMNWLSRVGGRSRMRCTCASASGAASRPRS